MLFTSKKDEFILEPEEKNDIQGLYRKDQLLLESLIGYKYF